MVNLKDIALMKKLTKTEFNRILINELKIAQPHVSEYWNNKHPVPIKQLIKIIKYFHLDPKILLD